MPVPWLALVKAVPWGDVVANAPKALDQAKKLVATMRKADRTSSATAETSAAAQTHIDPLPEIEARLSSLEGTLDDMRREALASAELVRSLAEQNAQLVQAVEILGGRVRRLQLIVVALCCIAVGGIVVWRLLFP